MPAPLLSRCTDGNRDFYREDEEGDIERHPQVPKVSIATHHPSLSSMIRRTRISTTAIA
jgi:hypothetical protein